jgi:two-component system, LytTR family, sensor kinase
MVRAIKAQAMTIRYPGYLTLLAACTFLGGVTYARNLLLIDDHYGHVLSGFAGWLASFYPWVILAPLVFRLDQRFPLSRSRWLKHITWLALASLPMTYVALKMADAINAVVHMAVRNPFISPAPWWRVLRCEVLMQQSLYWFAIGSALVIRNLIQQQADERRSAHLALEKSELENSLRRAELDTLRMRLNPHFLFNSLQNISALTRQDPVTASRMLAQLGDLLRSALRKGAQAEMTLAAEIELTRAYVAVEQMRFADRLSVLFDVEADVERALVPSFLLQPLVENAIIHGLRGEQRSGVIWIRGLRQVNQLVLTVRDNGVGLTKEKLADLEMGIGLSSTCERLERMYPGQHTLSIQKLPEGGTEVRIVLPLRITETPLETAAHELTTSDYR